MQLTIEPNLDLFLTIIFISWVLKGILAIIFGLAGVEKPRLDNFGAVEVIEGIFTLIVCAIVLFW